MLVWGWVLVILLAGSELGGLALEAFVLVFALINFPVLVVMGIPLAVLDRTVHPAVWVNLLVGSLTMWSGNYFFARWAEWRAWLNVPVSLHLADPASDRATGVRS
jgi:hypothetical protein